MSVEVTAPMSGSIFKIHVKVGDEVKYEDELIVLEALKMENPVYAPSDGKVAEVKVSVNDKVEANDLLLVLD